MTTDEQMTDEEWAYHAAKRRADFERDGRELPERVLLRDARDGDELAAQELLLWPKLFRREMIDPEVYDAIVDGALSVAAYVANECKSPKGKHNNVANVKASMFFNGAAKKHSKDFGKDIERKNARIALAVASGPGDPECLSAIEVRVALTRDYLPMMQGWKWDQYLKNRAARHRPNLIRDAEARLVEFICWKYSPADAGLSKREKPLELDEDLCKSLIAISLPNIQWTWDANKPCPPELGA